MPYTKLRCKFLAKTPVNWEQNSNLSLECLKPGALPYVDEYRVPVNRPLFHAELTPNDPPFFLSPHPKTPFFYFRIKFYIQIANFCAFRANFEKSTNFCGNFNIKFANSGLKLHFYT